MENDCIVRFDLDLTILPLINEWNSIKHKAVLYTDSRNLKQSKDLFSGWKIVKHNFDYVSKLETFFKISDSRPRFYLYEPNFYLLEHVDNNTLCSLNFVLNKNSAPITFGDKHFKYKFALINTTQLHSVQNTNNERIVFKLSIFNESFYEVKTKLLNNSNIKIL